MSLNSVFQSCQNLISSSTYCVRALRKIGKLSKKYVLRFNVQEILLYTVSVYIFAYSYRLIMLKKKHTKIIVTQFKCILCLYSSVFQCSIFTRYSKINVYLKKKAILFDKRKRTLHFPV